MIIATCPECTSEFQKKWNKKYCSPPCQLKANRRNEWNKKKLTPEDRCRQLLSGARKRSQTQNRPFDIDHEYLVDLWYKQYGKCAVSGLEFNLDRPDKEFECRFDAPSLDRIVPELGYIKGNIRFVIYQINMAIGPYGLDRLLKTIEAIRDNG